MAITIKSCGPRRHTYDKAEPNDMALCSCGLTHFYNGKPKRPPYDGFMSLHVHAPSKVAICHKCGSALPWKHPLQPEVIKEAQERWKKYTGRDCTEFIEPPRPSLTAAESIAKMTKAERDWAIREGYVREVPHPSEITIPKGP